MRVVIYDDNNGRITEREVSNDSLDQVRYSFNPDARVDVDELKVLLAAFISAVDEHGKDGRLSALARTAAEEASMWGVKSATT